MCSSLTRCISASADQGLARLSAGIASFWRACACVRMSRTCCMSKFTVSDERVHWVGWVGSWEWRLGLSVSCALPFSDQCLDLRT